MKKKTSLLFFVTVLFLSACSDDDGPKVPPITTKECTVIVYQNAQNSLGADNCHRSDSAEIVQGARFMGEGDRLLMYMDDGGTPRIYLVDKTTVVPQCVYRAGTDLDSSDPETLKLIVKWCADRYPASRYGLVLWSHADGWLPKIVSSSGKRLRSFGLDVGPGGDMNRDRGADGNYGSQMTIDDMAVALEGTGVHFDYIFFDACLMQCVETDYVLRNVADYIVAGPIVMPAIGANYYKLMQKGLFGKNPADIAESYFRYMDSEAPYPYDDYGLVISVVRTEGLDSLARLQADALSEFNGRYPDVSSVQRYADYVSSYGYSPEFFDAAQLMRKLAVSDEAYRRWKKQLDDCVVYKAATSEVFSYYDFLGRPYYIPVDRNDFTGISMFVPQRYYESNASSCRYGNLNEAFRQTQWYRAAGWEQKGW